MTTQTTNYSFTKDDINEPYDVLRVNANLDAIDTEIKKKETQIGDKANLVTVTKTNLVAAINEVKEQTNYLVADYIRSPGYGVTTGSANIYALTLNPALAAYTSGVCVAVKINIANTGASTININNLGPKAIKDSKGNVLVAGKLVLNGVYTLRYDGANFILQGEGGEYGTAAASDVLSGKTIGTDNGLIEGTIPSKTAATFTPSTIAQIIAAGQYLSGIQTIAGDTDLLPENIKNGVNLFGVVGTAPIPSGTATSAQVLAGYTFSNASGVGLTGSMSSNGAQSSTLTTQGSSKVIPAGYTTGGTVTANFANLVAGNIKGGVNVGGVVGTLKDYSNYIFRAHKPLTADYVVLTDDITNHSSAILVGMVAMKNYSSNVPMSCQSINYGLILKTSASQFHATTKRVVSAFVRIPENIIYNNIYVKCKFYSHNNISANPVYAGYISCVAVKQGYTLVAPPNSADSIYSPTTVLGVNIPKIKEGNASGVHYKNAGLSVTFTIPVNQVAVSGYIGIDYYNLLNGTGSLFYSDDGIYCVIEEIYYD